MFFLGVTSQYQVSSRIRNLNFWGSKLQGSIEHLRKLPLSGTQNLNLSYCGLNRESLQILGQLIVSGMNSLKRLDISRNPVCAGGTVELLQTLSIIKNLHTLNLSRLTLDCDDIRALAPLVAPQKGSLSELIIGSGKMERTAVEKMTTTILAESSLQSLSIKYIDVQLSTASLAQLLEKNPNLQTLELVGCSQRSLTVCAKALCKNTTLEIFITYEIGNDGAGALSDLLRVNQSLKKLSTSDYPLSTSSIDEEGAAVLIDALQYNQTLEKNDTTK